MRSPKLKILFDAGPLVNGHKSGVGYYTYQIIEALATNYPDEIELVGHYFNFLGRKRPELPQAKNIRYKTSRLIPGKILSITRRLGFQLPFDLFIRSRGDIALFTNFVSLPTILPIKKAIVIHDLCFEDYPQYLQPANRNFLKRFVPTSVKTADLIITISQSTKSAILKHYHAKASKFIITPIPPGQPSLKTASPEINLPSKYILFMSTLEPRKNYINLARAYSLLPEKLKKEYGLVLAGARGWQVDESLEEIKFLQEQGNNIVLTGYVSEPDRAYLYKHAELLAMPSHYEGFGMPLLEAMSYGVPVAASDIAVFHEVAAEAAAYFDKDDPKDIAKVVGELLSSSATRQKLIARGHERLEEYDWQDVATHLMLRLKDVTCAN
jgi:glycosyltransferase involved in cell wall biosynthesis